MLGGRPRSSRPAATPRAIRASLASPGFANRPMAPSDGAANVSNRRGRWPIHPHDGARKDDVTHPNANEDTDVRTDQGGPGGGDGRVDRAPALLGVRLRDGRDLPRGLGSPDPPRGARHDSTATAPLRRPPGTPGRARVARRERLPPGT